MGKYDEAARSASWSRQHADTKSCCSLLRYNTCYLWHLALPSHLITPSRTYIAQHRTAPDIPCARAIRTFIVHSAPQPHTHATDDSLINSNTNTQAKQKCMSGQLSPRRTKPASSRGEPAPCDRITPSAAPSLPSLAPRHHTLTAFTRAANQPLYVRFPSRADRHPTHQPSRSVPPVVYVVIVSAESR